MAGAVIFDFHAQAGAVGLFGIDFEGVAINCRGYDRKNVVIGGDGNRGVGADGNFDIGGAGEVDFGEGADGAGLGFGVAGAVNGVWVAITDGDEAKTQDRDACGFSYCIRHAQRPKFQKIPRQWASGRHSVLVAPAATGQLAGSQQPFQAGAFVECQGF